MNLFWVWGLLIFAIAVLGYSVFFLGTQYIKLRLDHESLKDKRSKGVLDDLCLATSEQLMAELRKRPGVPYLMLLPINDDLVQGISVEVHNIPPIPCLQMLSTAAKATVQELRNRGVEIPGDDDEEEYNDD